MQSKVVQNIVKPITKPFGFLVQIYKGVHPAMITYHYHNGLFVRYEILEIYKAWCRYIKGFICLPNFGNRARVKFGKCKVGSK